MTPALRAHLRSLTPGRRGTKIPGLTEAVVEYRSLPAKQYGDMTRVAKKYSVNVHTLHGALYEKKWSANLAKQNQHSTQT